MKARSFLPITFVSLTFMAACGSKTDDKDSTSAASTYTYEADTKTIINASCATNSACHGTGSAHKEFTTLAKIKTETAAKLITRITTSDSSLRMPVGDTSFETSSNGEILLDWLRGGTDLQ